MEPNERHPLLVRPAEDLDDDDTQDGLPQDTFTTTECVSAIILLSLILLTMEMSALLTQTAMLRVQPEIICRQLGGNDTCHDIWPMVPGDVFAEYATIQQVRSYLAAIPALLTALLYGLAADKYSRRNLLALSVAGVLISLAGEIIVCMFPGVFPLRLVWFTTLLTLIGGGPVVSYALVYAIANDVSSQAQRSTLFLLLASVGTGTRFLGIIFEGKDPWMLIYLGLAMACISIVLALFIPATRDATSVNQHDGELEPDTSGSTMMARFGSQVQKAAKEVGSAVRLALWGNKRLGAIYVCVLLVAMSYTSPAFIMLYSMRHLQLDIEPQNVIYISMGSSLVLTAAILPPVAQVLQKKCRLLPIKTDLLLVRSLIVLLFIGALLTGFSHSTSVLIAGAVLLASTTAFLTLSRSLISLISGEQHVAVLFCLMGVVSLVASLVGLPLLQWLWALAGDWDSVLRGLPFLGLASLFAIAAVAVLSLDVGNEIDESEETA